MTTRLQVTAEVTKVKCHEVRATGSSQSAPRRGAVWFCTLCMKTKEDVEMFVVQSILSVLSILRESGWTLTTYRCVLVGSRNVLIEISNKR